MSRYPVPKGHSRIETRVSNSRFIATLSRADSVEAARAFLRAMRDEMTDATHHVHAMRIGYGASVVEGMSDDGEPSGTSGPPVLAVLRGTDLGDVVLVITRYFGGTKLGTGGLVSAYGAAAKAVLAVASVEMKIERVPVRLAAPYSLYEPIRRLLETTEGIVDHEEFGTEVTLVARVPEERVESIAETLLGISAGRVHLERT